MVMTWEKRNKKVDVASFIQSKPLEWETATKVAEEMIGKMQDKSSTVPFKLSRKDLSVLDKSNKKVYQHSFLVFPDGKGGFDLGIMARGQKYDSPEQKEEIGQEIKGFRSSESSDSIDSTEQKKQIEEGIEGSGNFGIVKVVQFKDGSTYALKIEGAKDTAETKAEHDIMRILGILKSTFVRERDNQRDWTGNKYIKDKLYVLQKLAPGVELKKFLQGINIELMEPEQKYNTALNIALQIKNMHDQNIIHCDLKPENIMIYPLKDKPNAVLINLIDFGFSKELKKDEKSIKGKYLEGTPGYIAPEIGDQSNPKAANKEYSKASDIYAFGKILRELGMAQNENSPLNSMIKKMRSEDPEQRPTISEVVKVLSDDPVKKNTLQYLQNEKDAVINKQKQDALAYRTTRNLEFLQGIAELEAKYQQSLATPQSLILNLFAAVIINPAEQLNLLNQIKDIIKNDYVANDTDNIDVAVSKILTIIKNNQDKHDETLSKPSDFNFTVLKSLPFLIKKPVLEKLGVKEADQEAFLEVNSTEKRAMLAKLVKAYKPEKNEKSDLGNGKDKKPVETKPSTPKH